MLNDAGSSLGHGDVDDFGRAELDQAVGVEREHRVGGPGRGPHLGERQDRGVADRRYRRRVAEGRRAADRIARRGRASSGFAWRAGPAPPKCAPSRSVSTRFAPDVNRSPARHRRPRTPTTSRSRRPHTQWPRPRPGRCASPRGSASRSIVRPLAAIASTNRFDRFSVAPPAGSTRSPPGTTRCARATSCGSRRTTRWCRRRDAARR